MSVNLQIAYPDPIIQKIVINRGVAGQDGADADVSSLVAKADYTPAFSILVQQSGTGSPEALQVGTNTLIGRVTGGGSEIDDLSPTTVRTLLNVEDGATADQSGSEIKTAYESEANTNAFTDAERAKLGDLSEVKTFYVRAGNDGFYTKEYDPLVPVIAAPIDLADYEGDFLVIANVDVGVTGYEVGEIFTVVSAAMVQVTDLSYKQSNIFPVENYGATADGVTDDTLAIQSALDAAENFGGGTVRLMGGKHIISMAESSHGQCCLLVPSNVHLQGMGRGVTTVTRPASERNTDGVLICNKNYDTIGGYDAASNITYSHFRIEDEATADTGSRALGDLIGVGHADGVLIEWMFFGHHDQHAIDICQSRNVTVRYNESVNQRNTAACATYQIDAGLIWGIVSEGLGCENIHIHNNKGKNDNATYGCVHFHSNVHAKDVTIEFNDFSGAIKQNINVVGTDNNCSFENVRIRNNKFSGGHSLCRLVNLFVLDEIMDGVYIDGNEFSGLYRVGAWIGRDQNDTVTNIEKKKNLFIRNNIFEVDSNTGLGAFSLTLASIMCAESGQITGNVAVTDDYTSTSFIGWMCGAYNVKSFVSSGNELKVGLANSQNTMQHTHVDQSLLTAASVESWAAIHDNTLPPETNASNKWIQVLGSSSFTKGAVYNNHFSVAATITNEEVPSDWIPSIPSPVSVAIKPANEDRINTAVVAADTDLTLPLEANSSYVMEVYIPYLSQDSANGISTGVGLPSGATMQAHINAYASTSFITVGRKMTHNSGNPRINTSGNFGGECFVRIVGSITTSSTPGNAAVTWAQEVSGSDFVRVSQGAYIKLIKSS